jgi:hypothetical protein
MEQIKIGGQYFFNYSPLCTPLPEYTAHYGQIVTVLRALTEGEAQLPDPEEGITQMYRVRSPDNWEGDAWEEELEDLS